MGEKFGVRVRQVTKKVQKLIANRHCYFTNTKVNRTKQRQVSDLLI